MELFRGYKKNSTFASEIIHGIYAYEVYSANIQKKQFEPLYLQFKCIKSYRIRFFVFSTVADSQICE